MLTGTTRANAPVYAMQTGGISDAFLPGRNVAFLAVALAVAGVQMARRIWLGANRDDARGFPDCREPFAWAWSQMASQALGRSITLEMPLVHSTKVEVVRLARSMGLAVDATWSCYRPRYLQTGAAPCGTCDACRQRAAAIAAA